MDEDNAKEPEPSTSKNECQKVNSGHELGDKKGRDERNTNSETWSSAGSYSVKSRLDMAEGRTEGLKPPMGKRESKLKYRRKKARGERRRRGRIDKRKHSEMRRKVVRRPPKRKPRLDRRRELSVSTIFTRLSPGSTRRSKSPACKYCGHRFCLRRYHHRTKRVRFKRIRKNKKQGKKRKKKLPSECIQAGSRCVMLSPLFINTNSTLAPDVIKEEKTYAEVTPEMMYASLRRLTMWKEAVETRFVMEYIKLNYPVDPDTKWLLDELRDKLRVAVLVGIVTQISEDVWSLSSALKNRRLTRTHVTLFWKIYADTMRPITRRWVNAVEKDREDIQTSSGLPAEEKFTYDDLIC